MGLGKEIVCLFIVRTGCIGTGLADEDTACVAVFVVREDSRGQGIGGRLWREFINMYPGKNLALASVESAVSFYQQRGLPLVHSEIKNYRGSVSASFLKQASGKYKLDHVTVVDHMTPEILTKLTEFDTKVHPIPRPGYFNDYVKSPGVVFKVVKDGDSVVGFGRALPSLEGSLYIGPVFADTDRIGLGILTELLSIADQKKMPVLVNTTALNESVQKYMQESGLKFENTYFRLFGRKCIEIEPRKVFAITDTMVTIV